MTQAQSTELPRESAPFLGFLESKNEQPVQSQSQSKERNTAELQPQKLQPALRWQPGCAGGYNHPELLHVAQLSIPCTLSSSQGAPSTGNGFMGPSHFRERGFAGASLGYEIVLWFPRDRLYLQTPCNKHLQDHPAENKDKERTCSEEESQLCELIPDNREGIQPRTPQRSCPIPQCLEQQKVCGISRALGELQAVPGTPHSPETPIPQPSPSAPWSSWNKWLPQPKRIWEHQETFLQDLASAQAGSKPTRQKS